MNEYDRLLAPRPSAPNAQRSRGRDLLGKYDRFLADEDSTRAQTAILEARTPDETGRANKLARDVGVPPALVDGQESQYDTVIRQRAIANAAQAHPNIGRYMAASPRNAAVSADDTAALREISRQHQHFWQRKEQPRSPETWGQRARRWASDLPSALYAGVLTAAEGVTQAVKAAGEVRQQIDPVLAIARAVGLDSGAQPRNGALDYTLNTQRRTIERYTPQGDGAIERGVYSGVQSIPTTVAALGAAMAGNPAAGLGFLGLSTGGQSYGEARRAGLDPVRAAVYGTSQAAIEVGTERIPVAKWLQDTGAGTPFVKRMMRNLVAEGWTEQVATAAQDFNQWAAIGVNQGKTLGDYLAERPNAALETAIATVTTVGATNVAIRTGEALVERAQRVIDAREDGQTLDGVMRWAAKSKTKARDPESFREFVAQTAEGTPAENVYIPAEAIDTLMQGEAFEDETGFFAGIAEQLDEARATGGDVVVPLADVAATLAGTPAWEALKDDARIAAGGFSVKEALEQGDTVREDIAKRGDEIAARVLDQAAQDEPAVQVLEEVRDQLKGIGFADDAATKQAQLFAASREAWGARLGMSALDYHRANPVEFRRGDFDTAGASAVLDQQPVAANTLQSGAGDDGLGPASVLSFVPRDGPSGVTVTEEDGLAIAVYRDEKGIAQAAVQMPTTDEAKTSFEVSAYVRPAFRRQGIATQLYDALAASGHPVDALSGTGDVTPNGAAFINARRARTLNQGPRGQIALYGDRSVITLFETADLSTLIHETGHLFLEELRKNALTENAPADVVADWQTITDWFAANKHPLADGAIPREAHELFARGFERYAMEGKAPSSALSAAFATFRSWLLRIYQVVQNLRAPITPEVREVFDRMLATQDAIDDYRDEQNAKALFTDAAAAGMTEAEFDAYNREIAAARTEAYDALLFRTMERIRVRRSAEAKAETKAIRADVAASIDAEPRFRALDLLRTGRLGDETVDLKLDSDWLRERFGERILIELPGGNLFRKDGADADEIAALTGFSSGVEMVEALREIANENARNRALGDKRQLRDKLVDDGTNAIVESKGVNDPLTDGSIELEAVAAINNERQGEVIASETRALARRTGAVPTPYRMAREWARNKIAAGKVVDVASRSAQARYARAAAKASRLAEKAFLAQDVDEAFRQKQAQMLNHALFVEAKDAGDRVDTIVTRMNKLAKRAAMKSVDQDYFDRVHELLEKFSFRPLSQAAVDEREGFAEWAQARIAQGFEVFVPSRLLAAQAQHYSRVTVEELDGLADAVESLIHLGRTKQRIIDARAERDFNGLIDEIVGKVSELPDRRLPDTATEDPSRVRGLMSELLKVETIAGELDGGDPNGPLTRLLVHRATDVENTREQLRENVMAVVAKAYLALPGKQRARWDERVTVPELPHIGTELDPRNGQPSVMTRAELVAVALNTGNASNLDKLARGERWSVGAIREVLNRELTKEDWDFVQATWDAIDSLWPKIVETERRLSGVVPEKVEALSVTTPHGVYRGGYYPVVYDFDRSQRAENYKADDLNDLFGFASGVSTPKGHTITRTNAVGPIRRSVEDVLFRHVERVATRISYAEYARDVLRVIEHPRVRAAIDLKLGKEYRAQIQPWLKRVVNSGAVDGRGARWMESFMRQARTNLAIVAMGLRVSTGVAQTFGLTASAARIGALNVGRGMQRLLLERGRAVDFVMSRSPEMARRGTELNREVSEFHRTIRGKNNLLTTAQQMAFWHIAMIDRYIVSVPTWLGAHAKGIAEGMTDVQASHYADAMVRQSQGSGREKDLASVQSTANGEAIKWLTLFYTYFNVQFQSQWEAGRATKRGDWRKAMVLTGWFMVAAPLLDAIASEGLPGGDDDDDTWLGWASRNVFFNLFSGIPLARDVAQTAERKISGQFATAPGGPLARLYDVGEQASKVGRDIYAGEEIDSRDARKVIDVPGYALGLPTGQLGATGGFLWDYMEGDVDPRGFQDWYYGLTKGKLPDDKERAK